MADAEFYDWIQTEIPPKSQISISEHSDFIRMQLCIRHTTEI